MKLGRPPLGKFMTMTVNFKIPYDLWTQFKARCKRHDTTASSQLRAMINDWLKFS